jgi:NitT/TauT family transport system substrate-binding protein
MDGLAKGTVDVAQAGIAPILTAAESGLIPGKFVPVSVNSFASRDHPNIGVLVAKDIGAWKDLEGRKIGTNAMNSILTAATDARLRQEGVRRFTFVVTPLSNLGLSLADGNVAAVALSEPHLTQSILRGDGKLLDWVIGGAPFERMQVTAILFNADFRRGNPEGVKAFLRAHQAALRWINDHPDEARKVLAKRMKLSPEVANKLNLGGWAHETRLDAALLDQVQQVFIKSALLKGPVDSRRLFDESLLDEVLKEAR